MDLNTLQRITVDALEDIKAQDIKVYDTAGQTAEFDRVIVATGNSNRQTRALAWSVVQKVKEAGGQVTSVEGADTGEWVLVDLGDIVVHIMVPAVRAYYALEEIWGARPVSAKVVEKKAVAKKPAVKKAAAKKSVAKKSAAKKTAAKKTAVQKAPMKKSASKKSATKAPAKKAAKKTAKKGATQSKTAQTKATKSASKVAKKVAKRSSPSKK